MPLWYMPLSTQVYATFHFGIYHKVRSSSPSSFTHVVTRGMPLCDRGCHTLVPIDIDVFDLEVG